MNNLVTPATPNDASDITIQLSDETIDTLKIVSSITGVLYVTLFGGSLSFQIFVNYLNKSTMGYSSDFSLVNLIGFFFLLFNQTIGKINPYSDAGRVNNMDMTFAIIAFVCANSCYSQTFIYPSVPSMRSTRILVGLVTAVFFIAAFFECYFGISIKSYSGISLIILAAFLKAGSSLIKYIYQIVENVKNKSTEGLSSLAF